MMRKAIGVMLALCLVLSLVTPWASADQQGSVELFSTSVTINTQAINGVGTGTHTIAAEFRRNDSGVDTTGAESSLMIPTNLRWETTYQKYEESNSEPGEVFPGWISWSDTTQQTNVYDVIIYDVSGEVAHEGTWNVREGYTDFHVDDFLMNIEESGTYRFGIRAVSRVDGIADSEIVYSDYWTYMSPSEALSTPAGLSVNNLTVTWNAVVGAAGYETEYYFVDNADNSSDETYSGSSWDRNGSDNTQFSIAQEELTENGIGYYRVHVRALSNDITEIRNSSWSDELTIYYDGTEFVSDDTGENDSRLSAIIRFEANGGTDDMEPVTVSANSDGIVIYQLPDNRFTAPDGMEFQAWSVNGTEYAPQDSVTINPVNAEGVASFPETVVTALWKNISVRYPILDPIDILTRYENRTWRIDGPISEFSRLEIDDTELQYETDYTVEDGSTRISIPAATFERFGTGVHTITAVFEPEDSEEIRVSQQYEVNLTGPKIDVSEITGVGGVQYVPYPGKFGVTPEPVEGEVKGTFHLVSGNLPDGMTLEPEGYFTGAPRQAGTFRFTVGLQYPGFDDSVDEATVAITIARNLDTEVDVQVDEGYEIIQPIPDMEVVTSDQVFVSRGDFAYFSDFYLDGRKLVRGYNPNDPTDGEYYAEEGSTRITVRAQTLSSVETGTHTIAAEFKETDKDGNTTLKRAAQNVNIGISNNNNSTRSSSRSSSSSTGSTRYAVNIGKVSNGTLSVSPTSASRGTKVTITASPATGYRVASVRVAGTNISGDTAVTSIGNNSYTFTMPGKQVTVTAVFELIPVPTYSITISRPAHGELTVNKSSATSGTSVTLTATPEKGYMLSSVGVRTGGGESLSLRGTGNQRTFTMPTGNVTVSAGFLPEPLYNFIDVDGTRWFYQDAKWAFERGILRGTTETTFEPQGLISTVTAVVTLERLSGVDLTPYYTGENDGLDNSAWYVAAARWAKNNGMLATGPFAGRAPLNRGDFAEILKKYLDYRGIHTDLPETPVNFPDQNQMTPQQVEAFRVLNAANIFRGTGTGSMNPTGFTTRAHLAALLHRLSDYIEEKGG